MTVISNTTVISNFASIGKIDLLKDCFDKLYISIQVFEEIQNGLLNGYTFYSKIEENIFPFSKSGWINLATLKNTKESETFGGLLSILHYGEASCLSVAYHRKWLFLSDDKAARKSGINMGVSISGSVGILLLLLKRKYLSVTEADTLLRRMIAKGYYSPIKSLSELTEI